jgi:hypothetical protein
VCNRWLWLPCLESKMIISARLKTAGLHVFKKTTIITVCSKTWIGDCRTSKLVLPEHNNRYFMATSWLRDCRNRKSVLPEMLLLYGTWSLELAIWLSEKETSVARVSPFPSCQAWATCAKIGLLITGNKKVVQCTCTFIPGTSIVT